MKKELKAKRGEWDENKRGNYVKRLIRVEEKRGGRKEDGKRSVIVVG